MGVKVIYRGDLGGGVGTYGKSADSKTIMDDILDDIIARRRGG